MDAVTMMTMVVVVVMMNDKNISSVARLR